MRAAATHSSPSGSSENRSTEYSASTSMAAYQCFCIAPLSPLRRAMPVCSAAAHSASRRCRSCADGGRDVGRRRRQLAVLHADPAEQQRCRWATKPSVVAGASDGPADDAARAHRIAAVQRGQRDQRRRGVGGDDGGRHARSSTGPAGQSPPRRAVERQQQSLGEAARRARRRRRAARWRRRSSAARADVDVADAERHDRARRRHDGVGAAGPASGTARRPARRRRRAWRRSPRCARPPRARRDLGASSSSARRPAVAQSPVSASASARLALSSVAPTSAAARYSRAALAG